MLDVIDIPNDVKEKYKNVFNSFGVDYLEDIQHLTMEDWNKLNIKEFHIRKILSISREILSQ